MAQPAKRAKYAAKDLATKVKILKALKDGASREQVMRQFDVKRSTLSTYVKNEAQIMEAFQGEKVHAGRKRLRTAAHPQLEEALLQWIAAARDSKLPLSGPLICAQAERYALRMNIIDSFKVSEGWLAHFKDRHGLVFKTVCGERGEVDEQVVKDWQNVQLKEHVAAYDPNDVCNADETALFFKALPDKTITFKGDPCTGGKRSKERVTVLLAANMTGTERLPLLVIGKALKLRCFYNNKHLPVEYRANRKAWMTSKIFRTWLQDLDRRFSAKKRKVLLVVDNCSAHCNISNLEAIRLVFLPPNTTAALQPMDQGIIQYVKKRYRTQVLERMLLCMDREQQYNITLLSAIHILAHVWTNTPAEVVANCFKHSGFVRPETCESPQPAVQEEEGDDIAFAGLLPSKVQLADYVAIDDGVALAGQLTDDDIISGALGAADEASDEDDPCGELRPVRRTAKEAADALAVLEEFCYDVPGNTLALEGLLHARKLVLSAQLAAKKQTSITDFFTK
ncbi:tigger transposable element-derived protein 4 [Dermacentor silvarum]|uniref:tigger transposable element-derived protein 4 n=1 Tax=Dermacentor silvarum TaxID=543639 RepID=UPI001898264E|nr:tigger transposable element-derived protein 4 [Dermacentor silvarum]